MQIINGEIYLEDVPVTALAAAYGTPTYVYEENRIRANFRRALAAFRKYYDNFHPAPGGRRHRRGQRQ